MLVTILKMAGGMWLTIPAQAVVGDFKALDKITFD
jgi:hypothetical protein